MKTQFKSLLSGRRAHRVRAKITGTAERPRLSVNVSHRHVTAQLIDDSVGKTVAYVSTVGSKQTGNLTEQAKWVGGELANKAKKAEVTKAVFDRGHKLYHGRVKALAEAAREAGLEF